jgi:hypothetical protein
MTRPHLSETDLERAQKIISGAPYVEGTGQRC